MHRYPLGISEAGIGILQCYTAQSHSHFIAFAEICKVLFEAVHYCERNHIAFKGKVNGLENIFSNNYL